MRTQVRCINLLIIGVEVEVAVQTNQQLVNKWKLLIAICASQELPSQHLRLNHQQCQWKNQAIYSIKSLKNQVRYFLKMCLYGDNKKRGKLQNNYRLGGRCNCINSAFYPCYSNNGKFRRARQEITFFSQDLGKDCPG